MDHIDHLLARAVESRLDADVPVGCFLSGGVDSSLIALYASRKRPDIESFTVGMPDERYDESRFAEAAAGAIGIRHHVLACDAQPARDLVMLIEQLGLPFGDSSLLPTYWVCKAASERVRVCLSGDGGDELFGGYARYRAAHWFGLMGPLRYLVWPALPLLQEHGDPRSRATRRARFFHAAARGRYADLLAIFPKPLIDRLAPNHGWLGASLRTLASAAVLVDTLLSPALELLTGFGTAGAISLDIKRYLPEDILRKSDTASMSVALEVRSPFLDRTVVDTALQSHVGHLMPRGRPKGLLREVARRYLPAELVDRPKMGFAIPVGEWFRTDYGGMRQLLHDHLESADPFPGLAALGVELNMDLVRRMMREHDAAGQGNGNPRLGRDHSQRLYMLLVLSIWCRWLRGLRRAHPRERCASEPRA
ncbi:MAG: asparagine synthase C-terminal domain-containing protein [Phycisphaerales bacterium]|nr:asparagine synthase C-terminal domain-containing protein [Phycisphaerales bacterium]